MAVEVEVGVSLEIDSSEHLLRAVSAPSCLDEEYRATHLAFRLRNNEKDLSLSRVLYEKLKTFLERSFRIKFKFLSPIDVMAGVAELQAGDIIELDEHIVLKATPNATTPSHASIYFKNEDGTDYVGVNTTEPVDSSILGYEMALASVVRKVYDRKGRIIWPVEEGHEDSDD